MFNFIFIYILIYQFLEIAEVDLAFALSATSSTPDSTFQKMKSVVEKMIGRYDVGKVRYGLVTFGDEATTHVTFDQSVKNKDSLVSLVSRTSRATGGPNLDKAMGELTRLFNSVAARARPKAKKIAVVIIDKKSVSDLDEIQAKAAKLAEKGNDGGGDI